MRIVQLTTSGFFGGPERQMLGLALKMPRSIRQVFILFQDRGRSGSFRQQLREHAQEVMLLERDTPRVAGMVRELAQTLRTLDADAICTHGYKADLVGLLAGRRAGIPVVGISHGWTGETLKVRAYEAIDRACLRRMDCVVAVSEGQAARLRAAGVRDDRLTVIRNSIDAHRFDTFDPTGRGFLEGLFARPPKFIVGSAGRLSPEKGFGVLVESAAVVARAREDVGFVHFGEGPLRARLEDRIARLHLKDRFLLGGFRDDLDRLMPHWDLAVLPSFTEGLPNVVMEAFVAGLPVVATSAGGTPELVLDGVNGFLVAPGDAAGLARRILDVLEMGDSRRELGRRGCDRIRAEFTFESQAVRYEELFARITRPRAAATSHAVPEEAARR